MVVYGFSGRLGSCWERFVQRSVAGFRPFRGAEIKTLCCWAGPSAACASPSRRILLSPRLDMEISARKKMEAQLIEKEQDTSLALS